MCFRSQLQGSKTVVTMINTGDNNMTENLDLLFYMQNNEIAISFGFSIISLQIYIINLKEKKKKYGDNSFFPKFANSFSDNNMRNAKF